MTNQTNNPVTGTEQEREAAALAWMDYKRKNRAGIPDEHDVVDEENAPE